MREVWLPVVGYGDCYSVSNEGRVMRTKPRNIIRRAVSSRAKTFTPSVNKQQIDRQGYAVLRIGPTGAQKSVLVHRLVATAFLPNPNQHQFVNHIDGVKTNNNVKNLEWVTKSQNAKHAVRMGLVRVPGTAKLTKSAVLAIRKDTRINRLIAGDYGIHHSNVSCIKARKTWKNLSE